MGNHAFLSPSFGHIGYKCPASAIRSFQVNQRRRLLQEVAAEFYGVTDNLDKDRLALALEDNNDMANEGTAFHDVFEQALLNPTMNSDMILSAINDMDDISKSTKKDSFVINSFMRAVEDERDFLSGCEWFGAEHRVKIKGLPQFGTMDVVAFSGDTLYIRDLKTGRNEVLSDDNHQLMTYAVGILDEFGWDKFKSVELAIIGVRFSSNKWVTTTDELLKFKHEVMLPAFMEAYKINPKATPGDHCFYCTGKIHCKQWQDKFTGAANETFDNLDVADNTVDELVTLYKLCKQAENLAKFQLGPEILQQFDGFDVPQNIKRVTGAKKDVWSVDEDEVVKTVAKKVSNKTLLYKQTLLTPKQMTVLFEGENELLKGITRKVQNKPYLKL